MTHDRSHCLALAFVCVALGLTGCGGGDGAHDGGDIQNATIETGKSVEIERWRGERDNDHTARGRLLLDGRPVADVGLVVGGYRLRTDGDGRFSYRVDTTLARRYPISVNDLASATVDGDELTTAERAALGEAQGAITVAYRLAETEVGPQPNRTIAVRGRLTTSDGTPPPPVALFSYRLSGRVVDAGGRPRADAVVLTQSADRESSTFSTPTDTRGRYSSFYWPRGDDPVTLGVAAGDQSWELSKPLAVPRFRSARVNVRLGHHGSIAPPEVTDEPGAVYEGLLVGALVDGRPVVPLAGTWPDADGRFELVLPSRARNATVSFYQAPGYYFSRTAARPGRAVASSLWSTRLPPLTPRGLGTRELQAAATGEGPP